MNFRHQGRTTARRKKMKNRPQKKGLPTVDDTLLEAKGKDISFASLSNSGCLNPQLPAGCSTMCQTEGWTMYRTSMKTSSNMSNQGNFMWLQLCKSKPQSHGVWSTSSHANIQKHPAVYTRTWILWWKREDKGRLLYYPFCNQGWALIHFVLYNLLALPESFSDKQRSSARSASRGGPWSCSSPHAGSWPSACARLHNKGRTSYKVALKPPSCSEKACSNRESKCMQM